MEKLKTNQSVEINGMVVEYGRIPSGLVDNFDGIVFYVKTTDCFDAVLHENFVLQLLDRLESENEDHGVEWRKTKISAKIWKESIQVTVVSYRIRDIY